MNWFKNKKIALVYGGDSPERDVSCSSLMAIEDCFNRLKLNFITLELSKDILKQFETHGIDFCFIISHGGAGENGQLQALCEFHKIPYSGSDSVACANAMKKSISKMIARYHGINTLSFTLVNINHISENIHLPFQYPIIVKPDNCGSAVGVSIVRHSKDLSRHLEETFQYSSTIMLEPYIDGSEYTVGILDDIVLPSIQIIPQHQFYDYSCKYDKGKSKHIVLHEENSMSIKLQKIAIKIHHAIGCHGLSRVDFIVDKDKNVWFMEINTIPGMTQTSLFPETCASIGLTFDDMIRKILIASVPDQLALKNKINKNN